MADSETPVLDLLARMTEDSVATSSLEPAGIMLARIAAAIVGTARIASARTNLVEGPAVELETATLAE